MAASPPILDAGTTLPSGVPPLGTVLADKYRLDGILGVGGMGVVYRSNHALLNLPVAVKIILPEFASRPEFLARFTNEAKAAARIQSDHIARVSDVGTTPDGISFLVMELLEGEDLGTLIAREGPQPVERCVDWVLQAIAGLSDAHSAGIIHRDLKPSNLFLARRAGKPDRIKICDFGISKATFEGEANITKTNSMLGSPAYMAPEQLRSSRTVDKRADIWSLGIILYELLTGTTPFVGDSVGAVFAAILETEPMPLRTILPWIPEDLDRAILHCLRRPVAERYQDVTELGAALAPFAPDGGRALFKRMSTRPEPQHVAYQATTPHFDSTGQPASRQSANGSGVKSNPGLPPLSESAPNLTGAPRLGPSTPPAPGITNSSSGVRSALDVPATPPARRGLMLVGALGLTAVIATLVTISIVRFSNKPTTTATITPPPTAATVEKVAMTISASPAEAKISFDDAPLPGNPATMTIARDGTHHRVHVEAPGYVPKTQLVQANNASVAVDIALERIVADPRPSTSQAAPTPPTVVTARGGTRPQPTATATAQATATTPPPTVTATAAPTATATSKIYTDPWKN